MVGVEGQAGELKTKHHVPAISFGREKTNFSLLSISQNFVMWPQLAKKEAGQCCLLAGMLTP